MSNLTLSKYVFYSALFSSSVSLGVLSLNVKGFNIPEKRSSVLAEAHRHRAQVIFLQETHFKTGSIPALADKCFPVVFHAICTDSKTKDVSILLAKSFRFHLSDQMIDPGGRFLCLKGTWNDKPVTLANVYCPNSNRVTFLKDFLLQLTSFQMGLLVLEEDFNMALDPLLDTSTGTSSFPYSALRQVKLHLTLLTLHDA